MKKIQIRLITSNKPMSGQLGLAWVARGNECYPLHPCSILASDMLIKAQASAESSLPWVPSSKEGEVPRVSRDVIPN